MSNSIYSFEGEGRRKLSDTQANDAINEFGDKIGFNGVNTSEHKNDLIEFIINHHMVISRYQNLRQKEEKLRLYYIIGSFLLLVLIPILLYGLSRLPGGAGGAAQITAMLKSLLAVQKAMSSWLDKRKVIGGFWKAESEIKTLLYEFEGKWKNAAVKGTKLKQEFIDESKASIKKSKKIVDDEKNIFFNSFSYPAIDVENILSSMAPKSKAMFTSHASKEFEKQEKLEIKQTNR